MWKNNNILDELKALAPNLAKIAKTNSFKVPAEYFKANTDVWQDLDREPSIQLPDADGLGLPDNYFAEFPQRLKTTIEGLNTDELSLDKRYKASEVFKVPQNYFEQFENNLWAKIEDEAAAPLMYELTKENNFQVPENYFETLTERIVANVQAEASETLSSSKSTGFELPDGYFKDFEARLKERIAQEETEDTKVIQLNPERANETEDAPDASKGGLIRTIKRWGGVAAAAVMLLFLGINFFGPDNSSAIASFDLSSEIQKLDQSEIRAYVLDNAEDFDEDAVLAASGVFDADYQWYDGNELNDIDINALKDYYENDIL